MMRGRRINADKNEMGDRNSEDDKNGKGGIDEQTIKEMADGLEDEFHEYLDQGARAFCDMIEMTPDTTPEDLQTAIDGWDFKTMKLTVVRFRDFSEPALFKEGGHSGTRAFLRDTTPEGIVYRLPFGQWWIPDRAKTFAELDDGVPMLYAGFAVDGDTILPKLQSDDNFFIYGGFNHEELVQEQALTDDPGLASTEVYGIWDEVTGWVMPVTDNSVVVWRAYGEGRSNYLNVYWGDTWRRDHERYAMYYRNDPNDEPAVLRDIARYEAELKRIVTLGLDPRGGKAGR
ncbi:hypothetical protein [Bifidobacterium saguinibicoloris]|uniref:hypothetical protein n=1 Tax=Bifidobacterium saguinibicoloris TaxID=2834433 RepID=UPI001C55BB57|nr:hypothetical protein [Bifidobacterium saguinibicoloris]MBW3081416.1 hypothetical protein [Bifidobacterium saguinibicoloris]